MIWSVDQLVLCGWLEGLVWFRVWSSGRNRSTQESNVIVCRKRISMKHCFELLSDCVLDRFEIDYSKSPLDTPKKCRVERYDSRTFSGLGVVKNARMRIYVFFESPREI